MPNTIAGYSNVYAELPNRPFAGAERSSITPYWLFLFGLGILSSFYLEFGGQVYVAELFFLAILPFLIATQKVSLPSRARFVIVLSWLWLLNQAITDLVRGTPPPDLLKGWALIVFLIVDFLALSFLLRGQIHHWIAFAWGHGIGGLLVPFLQPGFYFAGEPWKFGFAEPIVWIVLLLCVWGLATHKLNLTLTISLLAVLGGISFYLNGRRWGGLLWLTAALLVWMKSRSRFQFRSPHISWRHALVLGGLFLLVIEGYSYAAPRGWLGGSVRQKFEMQAIPSLGPIGNILGGRIQNIAAIQAIVDAPILGHGSWASDASYRYLLLDLGRTPGKDLASLVRFIEKKDQIPAHSHVLRAWVWAGIMGGVFWLVMLYFFVRFILVSLGTIRPFTPLILYLGLYAVWDILFTPLGGELRIVWAVRFTALLLFTPRLVVRRATAGRPDTLSRSPYADP